MASHPRRVFISGAGIAGSVVAYWLGRAGIRTTLVERAPSLRTSGQTLDIHGVARDVIAKMGLDSVICNTGTHEAGTHFVDHSDRVCASFPVGHGMTNEIEVIRHRLATIFYEASKDWTDYIFGDSIKGIKESEAEAIVDFESGQTRGFDAIVIADGMRSLVFQTQETPHSNGDFYYKSLGVHTAYFSIPYREEDGMWSRWWTATGRRSIWLRPVPADPSMLACLIADPVAQLKLKDARFLDIPEQKKIWRDFFQGAGWQTERILDHMTDADDFYMQEVAQVRAKGWSRGRVALVGDAAYGPSPMSGMGTSCAITGAYVLASELAKQPYFSREGVTRAYRAYEDYCRPYVERAQDGAIGPIFLRVAWPESALGVGALRRLIAAVGVVANSRLGNVFARFLPSEPDEGMILPDYAEVQRPPRYVDKIG
jgi:2-polyprenyl-6-methoxyphenol hydroxylase-like FAD-dependent oxidoreductase